MELTTKEVRKAHSLAEAAHKKLKAVEDYLVPFERAGFSMRIYPSIIVLTTNIFKVQDVLGGELKLTPFQFKTEYFDVSLEVDGVKYLQSGLKQEEIDARQSNLDYTF